MKILDSEEKLKLLVETLQCVENNAIRNKETKKEDKLRVRLATALLGRRLTPEECGMVTTL